MSSAKVLVVLEGEQPEGNILSRLQKAFPEELADLSSDLVKIVFSSNIYSLYAKLKDEKGFLDVVEILKELHAEDAELQDLDRESVSQVYLFFDLDIHKQPVDSACNQLNELLNFFNNETENGKLFLSYPMVEAVNICDLSKGLMSDDRRLFKVCDCENNGFKHFVDDLNRGSKTVCRANCRDNWLIICRANYEKAQWLMDLPTGTVSANLGRMEQPAILHHQQVLIKNEGDVATLSAFPFFLLEYLGAETIGGMIFGESN